MPVTPSPLRYPGGKTKLTPYLKEIISKNNLFDGHYIEPYAGGGGLAISLLLSGYVRFIHLNDLDRSIYAFWHCVLNETNKLCQFIKDVEITISEWEKQKQVQLNKKKASLLSLGISTLFLNRTNHSGIIDGGIIGGKLQTGKYKMDVRFNRDALINKIRAIEFYKSRISIYNNDAICFLEQQLPDLPTDAIVNLDPPYYIKGQKLYQNFYEHSDHYKISQAITKIKQYWVVTYDNVEPIRKLYSNFKIIDFTLSYTAQRRYDGKEVLIIDPKLELPRNNVLSAI